MPNSLTGEQLVTFAVLLLVYLGLLWLGARLP